VNKEQLISFEENIAAEFNAGKIRAVIHLYSGGEEDLIRIFQDIRSQDWVFCSWRSHYQCLLKVPAEEVKKKILDGHSIALCFGKQKIVSSGIFGGVLPIAVGVAMSIKRTGEDSKVHCFLGDMTAESGIAYECIKYAEGHELPIKFHVEDNGLSVCSNTKEVWGRKQSTWKDNPNVYVDYFSYEPGRYPHSGAGKRVEF
jgi:pyruvate dehydrogenase E1 component alpha subunit